MCPWSQAADRVLRGSTPQCTSQLGSAVWHACAPLRRRVGCECAHTRTQPHPPLCAEREAWVTRERWSPYVCVAVTSCVHSVRCDTGLSRLTHVTSERYLPICGVTRASMARSRVGAHKGEKIISSGAPSGHRRARAMSPIPYLARFARKVSLAPSPRSHHRLAHFARTIACCSQARKLASSTPRLLSSLTTLLASLALLAHHLARFACLPLCLLAARSLRSPPRLAACAHLAHFAHLLLASLACCL